MKIIKGTKSGVGLVKEFLGQMDFKVFLEGAEGV